MKTKLGALYENLILSRGPLIIITPVLFLVKRIFIVALIIFQDKFIF